MMWQAKSTSGESGHVIRYRITANGSNLTFRTFLQNLVQSRDFRTWFNGLLAESEFSSFRWETPPLMSATAETDFEFVLLPAGFSLRRPDPYTFQEHFHDTTFSDGVVSFPNIRGDSLMIVPVPTGDDDDFGHLASFVRTAESTQIDALWKRVGDETLKRIGSKPLWLSTAGGGVAWLHVRLDPRPKYYGWQPYRKLPDA